MRIHLLIIILTSTISLSFAEEKAIKFLQCSKCSSAKTILEGKESEVFKSKNYAKCVHKWSSGVNKGYEYEIRNEQIVLLKLSKNIYGAFKFEKQSLDPKQEIKYSWIYGVVINGKFIKKDSGENISSSTSEIDDLFVIFGPFKVAWSCANEGKGYLYYEVFPWMKPNDQNVAICLTHLKNFNKLNFLDSKHKYKRNLLDKE